MTNSSSSLSRGALAAATSRPGCSGLLRWQSPLEARAIGMALDCSAVDITLEFRFRPPFSGDDLMIGIDGADRTISYAGAAAVSVDGTSSGGTRMLCRFGGRGQELLQPSSLTARFDPATRRLRPRVSHRCPRRLVLLANPGALYRKAACPCARPVAACRPSDRRARDVLPRCSPPPGSSATAAAATSDPSRTGAGSDPVLSGLRATSRGDRQRIPLLAGLPLSCLRLGRL